MPQSLVCQYHWTIASPSQRWEHKAAHPSCSPICITSPPADCRLLHTIITTLPLLRSLTLQTYFPGTFLGTRTLQQDIYVPDEKSELVPWGLCLHNDSPSLAGRVDPSRLRFLHPRVSLEDCRRLRIPSVSQVNKMEGVFGFNLIAVA